MTNDWGMAPLLIADDDIATTHIITRVIREALGSVDIVYPATLQSAELGNRTVIVSRLCLPELSWLPAYLNRRGVGYSYFLDDNFFELDTEYDKHNGVFFSHPATRHSLSQFIACADHLIVMSAMLADDLQRRFPTQQINTIAAPIDLALFDRLRPTVDAPLPEIARKKFCVGYPSTRRPNVSDLLTGVVTQSLARFGDNVEFEFMGWMPDALRDMPGVTFLPEVTGYENYVLTVQSRGWHAALAPLMDSPFENCKTNLKYREYAALGIAGVYSDVPLYASCVKPGQTGLLPKNNVEAWLAALNLLRTDAALRASLVSAARADVEKCYAQPIVAAQLRRVLTNTPTRVL